MSSAALESTAPPGSAAVDIPPPPTVPTRLVSLDAFRGAIMLLMVSSGLGFAEIAERSPDNPLWTFLAKQTEHAEWSGCTLWDLIQPAFMFMVGVAVPWSIANRRARGERFGTLLRHALVRSLVLILLAVFLTSSWSPHTEWFFTNVLAQIGLGYPFLFLLAFTSGRVQWTAAAVILFLYWLAFALYPMGGITPGSPEWQTIGVPPDWHHLTGFEAHWEKNANFAAAFDRWFLNLFPRDKPFVFSSGGYPTLNFIPSLATMIFGLRAGALLRSDRTLRAKIKVLIVAGIIGILLGAALALSGLGPIVKRIWTPSWAIFSGGLVALLLATFVALIEGRDTRRWTFPLIVVGLNPIVLYCMWQLMSGFVRENLRRHLGNSVFEILGTTYAPFFQRFWVLVVFWLILWWMYRRKIFIRI